MPTYQGKDRVPFTLTYVTYVDGDVCGFVMALLTLTPIFIVVALTTLVVFGHLFEKSPSAGTTHATVFLFGQLMNDGLSRILKSVFSEIDMFRDLSIRPESSDRDEGGMPSNHAQSVGYFVTYACLVLAYRCKFSTRDAKTIRDTIIVCLIVLGALVASSRVYLGYHTILQVGVGAFLGFSFALCFHAVMCRPIRSGYRALLSKVGLSRPKPVLIIAH